MRGGAVREPWERMIVSNLPFVGHSFLHVFSSFLHKIAISMKMVPKMDPIFDALGSCFRKKKENRKVCFDCTGAYGLHVDPPPGTPKAHKIS